MAVAQRNSCGHLWRRRSACRSVQAHDVAPTDGFVRRPVSGASDAGTGSVHEHARRWSAGIATFDAGVYGDGARADPPAAFLRANAWPAADVRPAPGDPAPNFCPYTTG